MGDPEERGGQYRIRDRGGAQTVQVGARFRVECRSVADRVRESQIIGRDSGPRHVEDSCRLGEELVSHVVGAVFQQAAEEGRLQRGHFLPFFCVAYVVGDSQGEARPGGEGGVRDSSMPRTA
ncbi:hypothetical protein ACFW93_11595 [Streptomyces canus]|uniref:hypothetical protein n=1 Tax=Streptomyces canus TaxID=58343 RepID=UPI00369EDA9A